MSNRSRQLDVTHSLASYLGTRYFNTTSVADNAFVADFLVLTAVALPVLGRTKDALTKQAVFFRPQCAVVNRLRFGHFSV